MPVGSPNALAMKSIEYRPILAASWMIGHGVSSRSSHSGAAGRIDIGGEVVHPLLDLQLVFVEIEREVGHQVASSEAVPGPVSGHVTISYRRVTHAIASVEGKLSAPGCRSRGRSHEQGDAQHAVRNRASWLLRALAAHLSPSPCAAADRRTACADGGHRPAMPEYRRIIVPGRRSTVTYSDDVR